MIYSLLRQSDIYVTTIGISSLTAFHTSIRLYASEQSWEISTQAKGTHYCPSHFPRSDRFSLTGWFMLFSSLLSEQEAKR
jgi:hypothetical protein